MHSRSFRGERFRHSVVLKCCNRNNMSRGKYASHANTVTWIVGNDIYCEGEQVFTFSPVICSILAMLHMLCFHWLIYLFSLYDHNCGIVFSSLLWWLCSTSQKIFLQSMIVNTMPVCYGPTQLLFIHYRLA